MFNIECTKVERVILFTALVLFVVSMIRWDSPEDDLSYFQTDHQFNGDNTEIAGRAVFVSGYDDCNDVGRNDCLLLIPNTQVLVNVKRDDGSVTKEIWIIKQAYGRGLVIKNNKGEAVRRRS
jgi:hypothetical protein